MSKTGPERIGRIITRIMARRGFQREISQEQLEKSWKEILGQPLASQTRLGTIRRGVLEVFVSHPALKTEISLRQTELLTALNQVLADGKIAKMKIMVMG